MVNSVILASGYYVPDEIIPNEYFVNKNPYRACTGIDDLGNPVFSEEKKILTIEKILKNTGGIEQRRRISDKETLVDLIEKAFSKTGFNAEDLNGIITASISYENNQVFPGIAWKVQDRLKIKKTEFYTADIVAACSGFTHALDLGDSILKKNPGNYLIAGTEALTRLTDYSEINCDLFGDGCGLVILGPSEDSKKGIIQTKFGSDVSGINYLFRDKEGYIRMPNGLGVFKIGTRAMINTAHELIEKAGLEKKDIKQIFPQQANGRMLDLMSQNFDNIYRTLPRYGNMSAANVPVAFAEARERKVVNENDVVILVDVGAGLGYGGVLIRL